MYIKTSTGCDGFQAVAYADASEDRVIHRVMYDDALLHNEWVRTSIGGDREKRIERKGEKLALQKLLDEMVERKQISVVDALAEMAKFMGGETEAPPEPEPTPEPEKPKLAFAVGDEVLVRGVIVMVDEDDETYPYRVRINNFSVSDWVEVEDIAGKVSLLAVKEEPKPEPVKYETGTKVRSKIRPHYGVGTYLYYYKSNDYDKVPHKVEFSDSTHWLSGGEIEVVTEEPKPETKFKVGDKVIHKFKPVWGVGEVLQIHQRTAQYDFFGGDNPETMPATRAYKVRYSHMAADGYYDHWNTAEENLFAA